ncbi:MAG: hypothetical protein WBL50_23165 [Candidatus Acidiferrum sp.]
MRQRYTLPMADYEVGSPVVVRLNDGRIVEAKIRAVIEQTNGLHLQVDYGHYETALVHEKQVRHDKSMGKLASVLATSPPLN